MLDRIWNGWRAQYVQRDSHAKPSDVSVFSEILSSGLPDEETFIVHRGETGVNVGLNLGQAAGGSVAQHLHVHIVPRWGGDSNFMVAIASTKILPEALDVTAQRVRARWKTLAV